MVLALMHIEIFCYQMVGYLVMWSKSDNSLNPEIFLIDNVKIQVNVHLSCLKQEKKSHIYTLNK